LKKSYLIGITGGSASGKTKFIHELLESFSEEEITLVSQDHYYHSREMQPKDENGIENFDTPESIDQEKFYEDLVSIVSGKEVQVEEYTFNSSIKEKQILTFKPAPLVVAEGLFAFHHLGSRDLFDLKIFIEANEPVKLTRRIIRDKEERGYDLDDVLYRYSKHVYPTYEKYIKPLMFEADIIIPNNKSFEKAMEVLVSHLKNKL
jgi:uridine kinase